MDYNSKYGLSLGRKFTIVLCVLLIPDRLITSAILTEGQSENVTQSTEPVKREVGAQRREHSFNSDGTVNYHGSGSGHDSGDLVPPPSGGNFNHGPDIGPTGLSNSYGAPIPSDSYGPPTGDSYSPPPRDTYGPPAPKPVYGPPKSQYRPPSPPKTSYGPPKITFSSPPKLSYGPPKSHKIKSRPRPSYGPPKPTYGVPSFSQGTLLSPVPSNQYGPPKPSLSFGTPLAPSTSYGPPSGPSHGPPTPPEIKYDGWKPIPGLVSQPPSSSYGPPSGSGDIAIESHGGSFGGSFSSPPSSSYGPPSSSFIPGPPLGPPAKPSSSYGPPSSFIPGPPLGPPAKPSSSYGPPSSFIPGPPLGPPANPGSSYGPPSSFIPGPPLGAPAKPSSSYGPPSSFIPGPPLGAPAKPSSSYGPPSSLGRPKPSSSYGPPSKPSSSFSSFSFGSSLSSSYGPPSKPSFALGPPISPSYGPPRKPSSSLGPPSSKPSFPIGAPLGPHISFGPPSSSNGPPKHPSISYGPPKPPSSSYGPPSISFGSLKPPTSSYGPPKPPSSSYGPPKSPSSSYGPPKLHSVSLTSLKPPSSSYGPPKPPSSSYGPPKPPSSLYGPPKSPGSSYGPPPPPSSSYGPPQPPSSSYGPPSSGPSLSFSKPSFGSGPSSSYGPPKPPSTTYGTPNADISFSAPPSPSYGAPQLGSISPPSTSYGGPPPPLPPSLDTSYAAPPSGSYGPPTAPATPLIGGCCGTPPPDLSLQTPGTGYGAPPVTAPQGPPAIEYGAPVETPAPAPPSIEFDAPQISTLLASISTGPSLSYGTPLLPTANTDFTVPSPGGAGPELPLPQPKQPVKFRPPVPVGLISSLGAKWGNADVWGGDTHAHKFQGNTYIPPAVPDPDPGTQAEKGTALVIPPPSAPATNYAAPSGGSTQYSSGSDSSDLNPPPSSTGSGSYDFQHPPVEDLPPPTSFQDTSFNPPPLTGYNAPIGGTSGGGGVLEDIPIKGNHGTYTLQIQPAGGNPSSDGVQHQEVLSNGLLQDILAAIENPGSSIQQYASQNPHDPEAHQISHQILNQLGLKDDVQVQQAPGGQYGTDLVHASSNNIVSYEKADNETVIIPKPRPFLSNDNSSSVAEGGQISRYLRDNQVALYFNAHHQEAQNGDAGDVLLVQMLPDNSTSPAAGTYPGLVSYTLENAQNSTGTDRSDAGTNSSS